MAKRSSHGNNIHGSNKKKKNKKQNKTKKTKTKTKTKTKEKKSLLSFQKCTTIMSSNPPTWPVKNINPALPKFEHH